MWIEPDGLPGAAVARFLEKLCKPAGDRVRQPVTIICAHPDDETIGVGTRLPRLPGITIVHVTDGAPQGMEDALRNNFTTCAAYSAARRKELEAAVRLAGVGKHQLHELGFPDQGVTTALVAATRAVYGILERFAPEVVITHPYEGGHPDHDGTAFAVHAACALIERDRGKGPLLIEMTSYHNSRGQLEAGGFLANSPDATVTTAWLNADEQELKRRMFACFCTQEGVLSQFPLDAERFRQSPRYDFRQSPHSGMLFYEQHSWGMNGQLFRRYASAALDELELLGNGLL